GQVAGTTAEPFTISPNGRYVAFATTRQLLSTDTNGLNDVYAYDLQQNQLLLVSATTGGVAGDRFSTILQTSAVGEGHNIFSDDGRYLVFSSDATNLVGAGGVGSAVYVRDLENGTTVLASIKADGTPAGGFGHAISGDGGRIVLITNVPLLPEDTDSGHDVYVRDLTTQTTTLLSGQAGVFGGARPTISRDGQHVLFSTTDITGVHLVHYDLTTGTTHTVHSGSDLSYVANLSDDGRYIAFLETTVAPNGLTSVSNLLFHDSVEQTTTVASLNASGTAAANRGVLFVRPQIDAFGSVVAFASESFDLIESDTNGRTDIFVFTRPLGGGSLRGEIFSDTDASGDRNGDEGFLSGWRVFLDTNLDGIRQSDETQVITAANGQYAFTGLVPGAYRIVAEQRDAFVQTAPLTMTYDAEILADETLAGLDFGFQQQFADLVAEGVFFPVIGGFPGESVLIEWFVSNLGDYNATGNWQDAVYLSKDHSLSPDDGLLGTFLHTGGLEVGDFYTGSLTVTMPAALPGDYYFLVETDRRGQVPQNDRTNDLATAVDPVTLDIPELPVDFDLAGTLHGPGQKQFYKIVPPADRSLQVTLDTLAASGAAAIYVSRNSLPTPGNFDFRGQSFEPDASLLIPRTVAGSVYYVMVEGQFGDAASSGFTLSARLPGFNVGEIAPAVGGNTGRVTVRIDGTDLTANTTVRLFKDATTLDAVAIDFRDASHLYATFDLTGVATGSYHLFVFDGPANDLVVDAFEVVPGVENPLKLGLIVPANFRPSRYTPFTVEVTNTSNVDVPAPLLRVSSQDALIRLSEQTDAGIPTRDFIASSAEGPAGILRAGQTVRISLLFLSNNPEGAPAHFRLESPSDRSDSIDWDAIKEEMQPSYMSDEAWDIVFDRFRAAAGDTVEDFQNLLAQRASYLSRLGIPTSDPARLMTFAIAEANNLVVANLQSNGADVSALTPGVALRVDRIFRQSIADRYRLGPLGRGWMHSWEIALSFDSDGNAAISHAGGVRVFTRQPNGTYLSASGDVAVLSFTNGAYQLREVHGEILVFRPDGKIGSLTDRLGNAVTANYDASGQLETLNHTSGASITFTYDLNGRLVEATDSDGQSAIYVYDGEHLIRVETDHGVMEYSYLTGDTPAREHAIVSASQTNGRTLFMQYDAEGRVIRTEYDGGEQVLEYEYGPFSELTVRQADGSFVTASFNDEGQVELIQDSEGRTIAYDYDANFRLKQLTLPTGDVHLFSFCACGSLLYTQNPQGDEVSMTYDPEFRLLTSIRDGAGNVTEYIRNANGVLQSIRYADQSEKTFTTDNQGNVTGVVDRRGNVIGFTYDAQGQLLRKDFEDGSFQEYTYDSRGNRLTASDNGSVIEMEYDALDRMTRVAYPNGRFLEFTYDAFGRRTSSIDQDGFELRYEFDILGRLQTVKDGNDGLLTSYEFDAFGRLSRKNLGSGAFTTYAYDSLGLLSSLVNHAPGGSISSRFDYTYDRLGQVSSMTTLDGVTTYEYDLGGQLTRATLPGGRTLVYEYDRAGNRTRVIDSGVETTYVSNNLNQYTSVGETTYTYDADGNLATRSDSTGTTTYSFDAQGQLIGFTGPDGTTLYEYDALGRRAATVRNGVRTEFLYDPADLGTIVAEYDSSGVAIANYIQGAGLIGRVGQDGLSFYEFDAVGNTAALVDDFGNTLNEYRYLPFGEIASQTAGVSNPFTYSGEFGVVDEGGGLYQMRARFYDAGTGHFLSNDPSGQVAGGINLRQYAINNPVTYVDPFGFRSYIAIQRLAGKGAGPLDIIGSRTGVCFAHAEIFIDNGNGGFDSGFYGTTNTVTNPIDAFGSEGGFGIRQKPENLGDYEIRDTFENDRLLRRVIHEVNLESQYYGIIPTPGNTDNCLTFANRVRYRYMIYRFIDWVTNTETESESLMSRDPNDITGPAGYGDQNYTIGDHVFPYTIRFENDPEQATAPAQEVFITHQLDADLDWTTFELGDVGFGSMVISVPAGRNEYETRVNYQNQDGTPLLVDFHAGLDLTTGIVTWSFRSVDPIHGGLPDGVFDGFLPVNDETGRGEGFAQFFVRTNSGLTTGTRIDAQASIVFDINAPVITNVFTNTIDVGAPSSAVSTLPAQLATETFLVSWTGTDDSGGSGIATFDIFVSIDGGPFLLWLDDVSNLSEDYTGQFGSTYAFYSIATDNVGHVEAAPLTADAQTTLASSTAVVVSAQVNGPANPNRSSIRELTIQFDQAVTVTSAGALVLFNHTTGQSVSIAGATLLGNGTTTITWLLADGPGGMTDIVLPDGRYTAQLAASATTPGLASDFEFDFHKLKGDVDGDALVNFNDYYEVRINFDTSGAAYRPGDADGDGVVNFNDYSSVRENFDAGLPPRP
ncbi:MAG: PD40 domain-containing protein, partial [Planctomycetaceae bacterium]|nr:PD40 domain-containing protein [Planctomycetaceae bacterium]